MPGDERRVLVLNVGSSSLKYAVVDPVAGRATVRGHVDRIGSPRASVTHPGVDARVAARVPVRDHTDALRLMTRLLEGSDVSPDRLRAVGHRVVHGARGSRRRS